VIGHAAEWSLERGKGFSGKKSYGLFPENPLGWWSLGKE
jgi:hypothetical protein